MEVSDGEGNVGFEAYVDARVDADVGIDCFFGVVVSLSKARLRRPLRPPLLAFSGSGNVA